MRYLVFVIMLISFATKMAAQDETLFKGDIETGGFGGPVVKYTSIYNQKALMVGGRGGWIINHSFVIGGGGYGVVTEVDAPSGVLPLEGALDIKFGYADLNSNILLIPNPWDTLVYTRSWVADRSTTPKISVLFPKVIKPSVKVISSSFWSLRSMPN